MRVRELPQNAMTRVLGLALLLASCLPAPAAPPPPTAPIHTVYASNEMAPDCIGAVVRAVERLKASHALELVLVPLDHRVFFLEPNPGEIAVRSDIDRYAPDIPAIAYEWLASDGCVERAELVFQSCAPALVMREVALAVSQVPSESRRSPFERPLAE